MSPEVDTPVEGQPGDRPVEQSGVAEPVAEDPGGARPDGALAARAGAIEADHEAAPGSRLPVHRRRAPESVALGRGQLARLTDAHAVEAEGADADPDEAGHGHADGREHPAELPPPALGERHAVPGQLLRPTLRGVVQLGRLGRRGVAQDDHAGEPLVETDARAQRLDLGPCQGSCQADRVLTLDAVARVAQALAPVAVVGQQDQPLGVAVEAADREEAPGAPAHVEQGPAGRRCAPRAGR